MHQRRSKQVHACLDVLAQRTERNKRTEQLDGWRKRVCCSVPRLRRWPAPTAPQHDVAPFPFRLALSASLPHGRHTSQFVSCCLLCALGLQFTIGVISLAFYAVISGQLAPYKNQLDDLLWNTSLFSLLLAIYVGQLQVRGDVGNPPSFKALCMTGISRVGARLCTGVAANPYPMESA